MERPERPAAQGLDEHHGPQRARAGVGLLLVAMLVATALGACSGRKGAAVTTPAAKTPSSTAAPAHEVAAGPIVLLRGARVMTAAGADYPKADVLLRGSVIAAIATTIEPPDGAEVVDLSGKTLTPGLIDTHSHIGVYAAPGFTAHSDGNEITSPTTPQVRAADGYWPQDPQIERARSGGVTTMQILPGSANLIGGQSVVVKTYPNARTVADAQFVGAPSGLKMACGENPKRSYGNKGGPGSRMGNMAGFRAKFQDALEYQRSWERYRSKLRRWRSTHRQPQPKESAREGKSGGPPDPPSRDFGLEAMVGVLEGRVLVHNHCYRADEMALMMQLADDYGFQIRSFHHAVEAYKIADLLAAHGAAASIWADWWGFKAEAFDGIRENAAMVSAAGARAILHSDSAEEIQRLNQGAAKAMWAGRRAGIKIGDDEALRWITANPAWALGIDDKVGTIEVGKSADITVWDGDPFSVYTHAERVVIEGKTVYLRDALSPNTDFESGFRTTPAKAPLASGASAAALPTAMGSHPPLSFGATGSAKEAMSMTGCTVHVGDGTVLQDASVRTQGTRIAAVSAGAAADKGNAAPSLMSAQPCVITPGFIAATSALGLVEIGAESSTKDDSRSSGHAIRAGYDASTAVNASSSLLDVNRIEGVTSAAVTPAGGLLAGSVAWIDLVSGAHRTIVAQPRIALAGTLSTGVVHGSRAAALSLLQRTVDDALYYRSNKASHDRRQSRDLVAHPADLEALWPVLDGSARLVMQAHRVSDILALIAFSKANKVPLTIVGATQAYAVADALAEAGVIVVVQPSHNLPGSLDKLGARLDNAALLHAAGVTVAIATIGNAHNARNIAQEAGIAVAHGLPHAAAVQAVTLNVAKAYGMEHAYGSLAPGKVANFVVWRGDPFDLSQMPKVVVIRGESVPLTSRQTELRDRYRDLSAFTPAP